MGKKSVNNLYKPMLEHSNVEQKFHKAAKGKTERPDVAVILEPTNIQRHGIPVLSRQDDSAGKHHVELHTESQPCRKERENHMVRCNRNSVIHGLLEQYRHIRHVPAKGQALCEC